ncbi:hypothetical protein NOCA180169 [metagenome]|uniref:Uncharacterized protein n=1 Tax=metagenome TaxID=256318 RepID=A0A2P2CKM0_9ZZZZ
MTTQLREELDALADTQTFSPDPSAWDRGRRARRRSRVVRGAAALAAVAIVVGAVALQPDRGQVQPAEVPGGAIPSVVAEPTGETLTDVAIGRASVAYVDSDSMPVLVDATTGEAHHVELPDFPTQEAFRIAEDVRRGTWLALSPDGRRLAYPTVDVEDDGTGRRSFITSWYRVVDLTTGESELVDLPPGTGTPLAMSWTTDGRIAVDVFGRPTAEPTATNPPPTISWTVDPATGASGTAPLTGVAAPGLGISATFPRTPDVVDAVQFETASGTDPVSELPADRYPEGAVILPIGWADNSLLVAQVGSDLVLLTSPDRPESEWTWRTLVEDVPDGSVASIAVDLVPDLDGDPEQELTHDFGS